MVWWLSWYMLGLMVCGKWATNRITSRLGLPASLLLGTKSTGYLQGCWLNTTREIYTVKQAIHAWNLAVENLQATSGPECTMAYLRVCFCEPKCKNQVFSGRLSYYSRLMQLLMFSCFCIAYKKKENQSKQFLLLSSPLAAMVKIIIFLFICLIIENAPCSLCPCSHDCLGLAGLRTSLPGRLAGLHMVASFQTLFHEGHHL